MNKQKIAIRIAALKPHNSFAALVKQRAAGSHQRDKRFENQAQKDMLQRLREAGL
ncbi:MAG: hypothetical protein ACKOF9_00550 [Burkholderiales bacterium]